MFKLSAGLISFIAVSLFIYNKSKLASECIHGRKTSGERFRKSCSFDRFRMALFKS
jgi:hypothetical protein